MSQLGHSNGVKQKMVDDAKGLIDVNEGEASAEMPGEMDLNHQNHADQLFNQLETNFDLMTEHEKAVYALYHAPAEAEAQLMVTLRSAGDARSVIRENIRNFYFAVFKKELLPESDAEKAFIVGLQIEINKVIPQLYDDFGSPKREREWRKNKIDLMIRQGKIPPGTDTDKLVIYDEEGGRIGIDFLREDGGTRQHMTDAWIRLVDRRNKGRVQSQPIRIHSKTKGVGQLVEAMTLPPKELCYGQIRAFLEKGKDLSSITQAINKAGKSADVWAVIQAPLLDLGITLPPNRNELIEAVTNALGTTEAEFVAFMRQKWPDPGEAIGLSEIQGKKWSDLQKHIATRCIEDYKIEIPVKIAEVFLEVYNKHLESTTFNEGMENHLNHGEKIPHPIIVETGASALAHFVRHYNKTKEIPKIQQWIDVLLLAQNERPDLALGKDGKYHYQKTEADFESWIAKAENAQNLEV